MSGERRVLTRMTLSCFEFNYLLFNARERVRTHWQSPHGDAAILDTRRNSRWQTFEAHKNTWFLLANCPNRNLSNRVGQSTTLLLDRTSRFVYLHFLIIAFWAKTKSRKKQTAASATRYIRLLLALQPPLCACTLHTPIANTHNSLQHRKPAASVC